MSLVRKYIEKLGKVRLFDSIKILIAGILSEHTLKGCVRYIFASLFLSLNESTRQASKNVFYFTWKALFDLEKIKS